MKAPSPAFSLYPKDIESDEACKAMTHAEFGMYMRLLLNCWTEGSIPSDPIRIQRILKISAKTFKACWPAISPCFSASGDRLVQLRLEEERDRQRERSLTNSERGRRGGRPLESTTDIKPRLFSGKAGLKPEESLSSSSSSSYPLNPEIVEPPMPIPPGVRGDEDIDAMNAIWAAHRGGPHRYIHECLPVVRAIGLEKTKAALVTYLEAKVGEKFKGAPADFAANFRMFVPKELAKVQYMTAERLLASQR